MKLNSLLTLIASATVALLLSSCASVSAQRVPSADLSKVRTIYVVHLPADARGVNQIISDQLNLMGYKAMTGEASAIPADIDAILTYQDKWMWDITMYMIELHIQLRAPDSQMALASVNSFRPSLQRKSPEGMAKEALESLLKQPQPQP
jgi:hypothetical protein